MTLASTAPPPPHPAKLPALAPSSVPHPRPRRSAPHPPPPSSATPLPLPPTPVPSPPPSPPPEPDDDPGPAHLDLHEIPVAIDHDPADSLPIDMAVTSTTTTTAPTGKTVPTPVAKLRTLRRHNSSVGHPVAHHPHHHHHPAPPQHQHTVIGPSSTAKRTITRTASSSYPTASSAAAAAAAAAARKAAAAAPPPIGSAKQPRHGDVTKAPSFQPSNNPLSPHDVYCSAKMHERDDRLSDAMRLFHTAANDGHVSAMVSYGLMLVASDERAAFDWLRTAAERGHPRAWYHLGQLFARGGAFEIAPADAAKCWHRAAQLGDSGGRSALGLCYIRGFGVKRDVEKGVAIVKQVAVLDDDVTAMKNLAWIYRHGKGVVQNVDEANFWFERAMKRDEVVKDADLNWTAWNISPV